MKVESTPPALVQVSVVAAIAARRRRAWKAEEAHLAIVYKAFGGKTPVARRYIGLAYRNSGMKVCPK